MFRRLFCAISPADRHRRGHRLLSARFHGCALFEAFGQRRRGESVFDFPNRFEHADEDQDREDLHAHHARDQ